MGPCPPQAAPGPAARPKIDRPACADAVRRGRNRLMHFNALADADADAAERGVGALLGHLEPALAHGAEGEAAVGGGAVRLRLARAGGADERGKRVASTTGGQRLVGRAGELRWLQRELQPEGARVLLHGPPGVGKSALATGAVKELEREHGGWLFLWLSGLSARALAEVLGACAGARGVA